MDVGWLGIIEKFGVAAIALFVMWKISMRQIESSSDNQRQEREQHAHDIDNIAASFSTNIGLVCALNSAAAEKATLGIGEVVHKTHEEIMHELQNKHDEVIRMINQAGGSNDQKLDTIVRLIGEYFNEQKGEIR